jgi:formylglycine-generating enzyme
MKRSVLLCSGFAIVSVLVGCGGNGASGPVGTGGASPTGGRGTGAGGVSATGGRGTGGATTWAGGAASQGGGSGSGGSTPSGSTPPSCASGGSGIADCGSPGESCCSSTKVQGGTFYRTYGNDGAGTTGTDPATISDFRLDKYLVTVGRFRKFVAAWDQGSGFTPATGSGKHVHLNGGRGLADSGAAGNYETGWLDNYNYKLDLSNDSLQCQTGTATWTNEAGGNEKLPMNCINWYEAYAFCIWDGGFLASEAEYVYAAAGGSEQRKFPWGATSPGKRNEYAVWGCNFPDGAGTCDGTTRNIAPVDVPKPGAGRWGQLNLVGNLIEWYLDWFSPSYATPCTDCANLADGSGRAPRDGYFASTDEKLLQSSYRNNGFYPANRFFSYGFRCARTP